MGANTDLARHVAGLRLEQLPEPIVACAKGALLNFFACAVAGSTQDVVARAAAALLPYEAPGDATIVADRRTSNPVGAAFLNCLSSSILAFDETHARSIVHPVGPVAAAALAFAEEHRLDGRSFLCALTGGIEVASRASLAISVAPARGSVGWSQTGVCGGVGAAAAVARLLGLDEDGIGDAIALGANAGAGLRAMNGTMAVSIAASNAAANGFRAAALAANGVRASRTALEDPYGFVALYAQEGCLSHLTANLGASYAVSELHFKPYPCGIVAHAAIDAARTIRARQGFDVRDVVEVIVEVDRTSVTLGDRPVVEDEKQASVSIQYWVATALLRDDLGPDCLSPAWLGDLRRNALQASIRVVEAESLLRTSAIVTARLRSGASIQERTDHPRGSDCNPMTFADIEAKFSDAASPVFGAKRVREIAQACGSLEQVANIGDLIRLMRLEQQEPDREP